jgi:hypothetical protein
MNISEKAIIANAEQLYWLQRWNDDLIADEATEWESVSKNTSRRWCREKNPWGVKKEDIILFFRVWAPHVSLVFRKKPVIRGGFVVRIAFGTLWFRKRTF